MTTPPEKLTRRWLLGSGAVVALALGADAKNLLNVFGKGTSGSVPTISVAPVISGSAVQGSVLACTTGTWNNSPSGYAYQWTDNGSNIGGATSSTFNTSSITLGHTVACKVTASNGAGPSAPATSSNSVTIVSAASLLVPGGGWSTGVQNAGFPGGVAPTDPARTTAKPVLRQLFVPWAVTYNNAIFVFDCVATGGIASVTGTLEGGTPVVKTAPELVTFSDANGVTQTVFGYAFQIDNTATLAVNSNGIATLSVEAVANDGTMQHRVANFTIYPRSTEFTITKTVGASGKDYTTVKAALDYARTNTTQRVKIELTDNGANYKLDGVTSKFLSPKWWTVITHSPGITCTLGDGTQAYSNTDYDGICYRGSGLIYNLAKLGYNMAPSMYLVSGGINRCWLDGVNVIAGTGDPAHGGAGSGATITAWGDQPDQFWCHGDVLGTDNLYFTEVTAVGLPGYGLSFAQLRRNSTVDTVGGTDNEWNYCVHGGWTNKAGGYWCTLGNQTPFLDIWYTGSATVAQYARPTKPGTDGNFELYEDSPTPTYTLNLFGAPPGGGTYTTTTDLVNWINTKPGWHASLNTEVNGLGARYVSRADLTPVAVLPKTVVTSTHQQLTKVQDVHADIINWTASGVPKTYENIGIRFYEARNSVYSAFIGVPDSDVILKDLAIRNCSNSDVSASVGQNVYTAIFAGTHSHNIIQYVDNTNTGGIVLVDSFDAYCLIDRYAGPMSTSGNVPKANLVISNTFSQQAANVPGADSNSKAANVASSTLYVNYTGTPPDFTPISSGSPPLRLADLTWAGRYLPTGVEQGL